MSRYPFARVDRLVQRPKIKPRHERPYRTHRVIAGNHLVQCCPMQVNLATLWNSHPRRTATLAPRRVLIRQVLKQSAFLSHRQLPLTNHRAKRIIINHGAKASMPNIKTFTRSEERPSGRVSKDGRTRCGL
jgi:hypothetical protein